MNTRKANLKKLRLPSTDTNNGPRNGLRKATKIVSEFFPEFEDDLEKSDTIKWPEPTPSPVQLSPPLLSLIERLQEEKGVRSPQTNLKTHSEENDNIKRPEPIPLPIEEEPVRSTRTKLKTFLPQNKRLKPVSDNPLSDFLTKRQSNDFEIPAKTVKTVAQTKVKAKAKPRPKRQQKIKSAFFKNEELFSDVTAQHCLVDNINPDEMQMALALSRSEVELSGSSAENKCKDENEDIRDKLKKFGFQVAKREDYNHAAAYKLTKTKNKWANKFTSLTLRDPNRQLEKANQKVEEVLKIQFSPYDETFQDENGPKTCCVHSSILLSLVAKNRIIQSDSSGRIEIVDFYVLSLFEPSTTSAGYLLKDMRKIPGRDRSPENKKASLKDNCVQIKIDSQLQSPALKRSRIDETQSVSFRNIDLESNETLKLSIQSLPSTISLPDHSKPLRRKTPGISSDLHSTSKNDNSVGEISDFNGCEKETNLTEESSFKMNTLTVTNASTIKSQLDFRLIRATSPDIFADSDVEMETDNGSEMEKLKLTSSEEIIQTYEIYSSDEVKISSEPTVEFSDNNHNSISAIIDLTQQETETSSQSLENLIPSLEPDQPYLEFNRLLSPSIGSSFKEGPSTSSTLQPCLEFNSLCSPSISSKFEERPSTGSKSFTTVKPCLEFNSSLSPSLSSKFEEEPSTSSKSFRGTDFSFGFNKSGLLEKSSSDTKNKSFSFGSSASEDFNKSSSFNKLKFKDDSINITQNDDEEIDCIVLSDDEVNYSIWKADKLLQVKDEKSLSDFSPESDSKEKHEFSFVDFVAATQPLPTQSEEFELNLTDKQSNSVSSLEMDLSKRSDFGILEEQSPFKTPTKTPKKTPRRTPDKSPKSVTSSSKCRRALSESFFGSPMESTAPFKRYSSSNNFKEFLKNEEESSSDLDDIDKLIYGSPSKKVYKKPTGLTQLLEGAIKEKIVTPEKSDKEVPQEFEFNGRIYLVRTVDVSQRPNFAAMDESALFDKLYRYGIKPLKRKQAEKILEYIYNQTHPCLVDEADFPTQTATNNNNNPVELDDDDDDDSEINEDLAVSGSKFNLKDCWGHVLVSDTTPSMEIKDEQYIVQTNTSKKISTALLPFHIAWYNLLQSNTQLHEAILYYEPIDLQEVYLFFKSIGYRYEPKQMKSFFDSRSIIFRYDVKKSDPSAGANRHVRKKKQKLKPKN